MESILPLILVGLGCATLIVAHGGWLVLVGLVMQWAGLITTSLFLGAAPNPTIHIAEGITALVCTVVLGLTLAGLTTGRGTKSRLSFERPQFRYNQPGTVEDLWPIVVALAAAIAGLVLARLYPLGGAEGIMIAFYWSTLAGLLALVLDGAREPVKLAAGLLALFNSVAVLLNALLGGAPAPLEVGLMSISRIALALVLAFSWTLLYALFSGLTLAPLFPSTNRGVQMESVSTMEPHAGEETYLSIEGDGEEHTGEEVVRVEGEEINLDKRGERE